MPAEVTGRLTNSKGAPLVHTDVELELVELQDPPEKFLSVLSVFTTDADGNFLLTPLYRGRYIIRYDREIVEVLVPASSGSYVVSDILPPKSDNQPPAK